MMRAMFVVMAILPGSAGLAYTQPLSNSPANEVKVRVAPAPADEPLSKRFTVSVEGKSAPVYVAKVNAIALANMKQGPPKEPWVDGEASFASFDTKGKVEVTVTCSEKVKTAKVLPTSYGIKPDISGNVVRFSLAATQQATLEVNGDWNNSLHLFANPLETEVPSPNDPNVIYFGPGTHVIDPMRIGPHKTIYIAAGAVVRGKPQTGPKGAPLFSLLGSDIKLRGRGILDGGAIVPGTISNASVITAKVDNLDVEGVVIRNASSWNFHVLESKHVRIRNIKVFGWILESDGVDICNSQDVELSDSFLRTFDDLAIVKTEEHVAMESRDITFRHLVLWNEKAHALSLGAAMDALIENVKFIDCDVIHDKGHDWLLRIYDANNGLARHIVFENIRIEEDHRLASLWIGKAIWTRSDERGHIEDVVFRNIQSTRPELADATQFIGYDADHAVRGVRIENVTIDGKPLTARDVEQNAFVSDVTIAP